MNFRDKIKNKVFFFLNVYLIFHNEIRTTALSLNYAAADTKEGL